MRKIELTDKGHVKGLLAIAEGAPVPVVRSCGHVEDVTWQLDVDAGADWLCADCQDIKDHVTGVQQHSGD